ncbi:uncharacterized protein RP689-like [Mercenaria mercenaria]|uniref:uncharacterized protein RP689-like n=1 Tax=Mercenaria mercenaria TaxID=6596 RepID=UPI00234F1E8E|nr:uncharacterized protein RP689-like [Mercenaria mercenaria]
MRLKPCDSSEEKNKDLRLLIKTVTRAFEIYNVTYWVDYGTALGAYRYCDVIPWDHDADISYLNTDYTKVVKAAEEVNKQNGFSMDPEKAFFRNQSLDLFPWEKVKNWLSFSSVYKFVTGKTETDENYRMYQVNKAENYALKTYILNVFLENFPAVYLSNRSRVQFADFKVYTVRNLSEFVRWKYYFTHNKVVPFYLDCLNKFYNATGGMTKCVSH